MFNGCNLRRFVLTLFLGAFFVGDVSIANADLRSSMGQSLAEQDLAGVSWMLIGDGGQVTTGSAGFRDRSTQSPFDPDTRFHVGSLTKAVLASGILRLATQGAIDLDGPVASYLPGLLMNNPWKQSAPVTVRHLLDHTSGLSDAQLWQMFSQRADPDTPLIAAFPKPQGQLEIRFKPGSRMSYSNSGYTLLGMIIESVVDERYETYLDHHLLKPLGMHNSTFDYTSQLGPDADPTLAWGHIDDGERYPASPVFLRPAAQFTTTAMDLARFAQFLMGTGIVGGKVFIEEALMQSRGKANNTDAANKGLVAGYGLGLGRRDRHGVVGYCHGGNIVGFVARLCIFPSQQKAYAYSVNTDSETANYGEMDALLIEALELPAVQPPQSVANASATRWKGRYIPSPNRFQSFAYLDQVFGATKVSANKSDLVVESLQRSPRQLRSVGADQYSANGRVTASHVFFQLADDQRFYSDGFQTFEKISTINLFAHRVSLGAGLLGLLWIVFAGSVSVIFQRKKPGGLIVTPAWVCAILLCLPVPFFLTQSFMALGDVTLASTLLAITTGLLPLGMIVTLVQALRAESISTLNRLHWVAAVLVLQWCVVLMSAGLLPFRLWA